jgi:hypothetical protein
MVKRKGTKNDLQNNTHSASATYSEELLTWVLYLIFVFYSECFELVNNVIYKYKHKITEKLLT